MTKKISPRNEGDVFKIKSEYRVQFDEVDSHKAVLGVDPGTANLGLAYLVGSVAHLYEIELLKRNTSVQIIKSIWDVIDALCITPKIIAIEGASYNEKYGQVSLETVRSGVIGWAITRDPRIIVKVAPPKAIRKVAFGSGVVSNPWKELPDNSVAALGCALYGIFTLLL